MKMKKINLIKPKHIWIIIFFIVFASKINSQEPEKIKKLIIEIPQLNERLLSPPTEKRNEKIKLIPPKSIQKKEAKEEEKKKKKIEAAKKAKEEKKKKELEAAKKAEEEKKRIIRIKEKGRRKRT